jgi:hypothetical protein
MISRMWLATTLSPMTAIALAGFTQVSTSAARAPREPRSSKKSGGMTAQKARSKSRPESRPRPL